MALIKYVSGAPCTNGDADCTGDNQKCSDAGGSVSAICECKDTHEKDANDKCTKTLLGKLYQVNYKTEFEIGLSKERTILILDQLDCI